MRLASPLLSGFAALLIAASAALADDIGYLGPRGTYSEQAAEAFRDRDGNAHKPVPFATITEVIQAVLDRKVPLGLIPAENSGTGFPAETARNLLAKFDPGFRIVGEVTIPIEANFLVKPGTKPADIRKILSHPNALKEVSAYLRQHYPNVPQEETRSTAAAAEMVARSDGTLAAIASPAAGKLYALEALASGIQNDRDNATSFWAIKHAESAGWGGAVNRLVLAIEAPPDSDVLSRAIVSLVQGGGWRVVNVNQAPLGGPIHGYRFVVLLASDHENLYSTSYKSLSAATPGKSGKAAILGAWQKK